MKKITKTVLAFTLVATASITTSAQETTIKESKTKFSIEIDPSTFAFKGYGVHLRIQPKNSKHLLVGAGVYAMDFPDVIVGFNPDNKDKGWDVRLNQGGGLFGEYHFSEVNKKWFVGTQQAIQEYEIENEFEIGSENYKTYLGLAYGGYTFKPFKNNGFYVKTWLGAGYTSKISGENKLGNSEYDIAPILFFGAVHLGYTF